MFFVKRFHGWGKICVLVVRKHLWTLKAWGARRNATHLPKGKNWVIYCILNTMIGISWIGSHSRLVIEHQQFFIFFLAIMLWERLSKLQIKLKSRRDLLFPCFLVARKLIVSNSLFVLPQNFETYFFDNIGINMPTHPYAKLELLTSDPTQQEFSLPLLIWYHPFVSNNISA